MQLDHEIAVERLGNAQQRVDPRRAAASLEPGDRRLRRAAQRCQLTLRHVHLHAAFCNLVRDRREEVAAIAGDDPLAQTVERALQLGAAAGCHRGEYSGCAMSPTRTRPGTSTAPYTPNGSGSETPSRP